MALTVTAAGGLCLLAGVLMLGHIVGSYDLDVVLASGDRIRAHALYPPTLVLVLLGALTKSAQFPFHFWLPHAMAAPTPVSAYLHSATMVKAGVFLLARLWPVLSGTDAWFWIVGGAGLVTLLLGAYVAIFQHDLKGLLAYSTISHLGLITLLLGLNSPLAAVAAIFHIINHATFKASLFMAAGIIDHETGTRDMRRLSGLYRFMPITAHAGHGRRRGDGRRAAAQRLPVQGDVLRRDGVHQRAPGRANTGCRALATLASVFAVAYSLRFIHDVFFGPPPTDLPREPHEPRALDARAGRAAGAGLPGGRRAAGLVDRRLPGHRGAVGARRHPARLQPGGLARLQPAAGDERGRDCRRRAAVPALRPAFKRRSSRSAPACWRLDGQRIFERVMALASDLARRAARALPARAGCSRSCCGWW